MKPHVQLGARTIHLDVPSEAEIISRLAAYGKRPAAYQLGLFGEPPRVGHFRQNLWYTVWAGCAFPLMDDELRQIELLSRDFSRAAHQKLTAKGNE